MGKTRKFISILLACLLIIGAFPVSVFAGEEYVASVTIGDSGATEYFTDLGKAITEAAKYSDCTVTILKNITLTEYCQIKNGRFIIDLNGKTVSNERGYVFWINEYTDITFKDSLGGGKIERTDSPAAQGEAIHNEGTLTIESGIVSANEIGILSNRNVIVNGGTITGGELGIYVPDGLATINKGSVSGGAYAVWVGSASEHTSKLTVTGGTLSDALYLRSDSDSSDSIILKGGTFKGGLTIDGGTLTEILAEGAAYWQDGNMLTSVNGNMIEGDVTVKAGKMEFAEVILEYNKVPYDGTIKKPEVQRVLLGGKELAPQNYTISYGENINVGRGTVTLSAKSGSLISGSTEVVFAIMPDTAPIDPLTVDNVTSDDIPAIMGIYDPMKDVDTDGFKDDVKDEWDGIIDKCEELLGKINEVKDKIDDFEDKVNAYDIDEVTSDDYDDIASLIAQIEEFALSPNVTDEEEQKLNDLADKARDLLGRIDEVRDKMNNINNELPKYDEKTVNSDDRPALTELADEIKDLLVGDNLTSPERDAMQDNLKKVEALLGIIDDVAEKIDDVKDTLGNLSPETIVSDDEEKIIDAIGTIDGLLATDNLTEDERKELENLKALGDVLLDAVEKAKELDLAKDAAKEDLRNYKNPDDYRDEQKKELADGIDKGCANIDSAKTPEELAKALADAKAELDKIKTDSQLDEEELQAAKDAAKKELENYKNPDDYRDAEKKLLADAVNDGKGNIDDAGSIDDVNKALEDAKNIIDGIKTDADYDAEELAEALAKAKEDAKKELENYKKPDDYRDEQKKELADAVDTGKGNIDDADSLDGVKEALNNAKAEIDKIKTDEDLRAEEAAAEALAKAKEDAKKELENYKNPDDYRDEQKKELSDAVDTGKGNIDDADSLDDVKEALDNAKAEIDKIKTDKDLLKEEAAEYLLGDVDRNGKVNALDATQILRYSNNKPSEFTKADERELALLFLIADVDKNGVINAIDATQILRYANNKTSALDGQI